jgi:hypothetical protein
MTRRWALPLAALVLTAFTISGPATAQATSRTQPSAATPGCQLRSGKGDIEHVIYLQFDNTHFLRDAQSVPSDLEQMPHLLNFIRSNGTLLTNDHTVLISHTANGILTSLTGVYPDRHGQPVANSFRYFKPDGTTNTGVSFAYWTAPVFTPPGGTPPFDTTPNMLSESGRNAPAPWVPFTRAGCNFGAVAMANTVLENTGIDIPTVFGASSPEAAEVASNPGQAFADFVGAAVHCAAGDAVCSAENNGRPDLLPDEPGGYAGYNGLFGAKYVNPVINPGGPLRDLDGNVIQDAAGHVGFPGFDGVFPTVTLSYIASMQEHGIPVTFGYISDAHDGHGVAGEQHIAYGPGEPGYVAQLKQYDEAFAKFFDRLAADGITKDNTLFVFTVEEGDHFVGSQPTPAGCDGVSTPCSYSLLGEINGNLRGLLATQQGITTPFTVHADMAPTVYITGNPSRTAPVTRDLERAVGRLTAVSPYTGQTDNLTVALADPVEMKALHMITADPARTPTFTMFADPDYFLFAGAPNCASPCVTVPTTPPTFAWNHGSIEPEIAQTWLGMVGPGVRNLGQDDTTWADHTDVRPTTLSLLGLRDDYIHDGRVIAEPLYDWAVPQALRAHRETLLRLGTVYKQLNAPFGEFAKDTLVASTRALKGGSSTDDATYTSIEDQIQALTSARDALASQIRAALEGAAFDGDALNEQQSKGYIDQAERLIDQAATLAAST